MRAKDYLEQVRKLNAQLENKRFEQAHWRGIALGFSSASAAERVQSSGGGRKTAEAIDRSVDAGREADAFLAKVYAVTSEVVQTIEQLPFAEYDVLHKRYIQGMTFDEIAGQERKSRSWAMAVHRNGLRLLQEILDGRTND